MTHNARFDESHDERRGQSCYERRDNDVTRSDQRRDYRNVTRDATRDVTRVHFRVRIRVRGFYQVLLGGPAKRVSLLLVFLGEKQGHGVANDHAAFDHGDQARLPKFLRFMNISLHR